MKTIAALGLSALALAAPAAAAAPGFRFERTLESSQGGPYSVVVDRALAGHAEPSLGDLRIVDADGVAVPWRVLPGETPPAPPRRVALLDVGREGRDVVALVDLGPERAVRSRLELDIPGGGFVGHVTVSGGDDRTHLRRLSEVAVWDIKGASHSRSTAVTFPPSDLRYLELRARGIPGLRGATVAAPAQRPPRLGTWPATVTRHERAHTTVLRVDLGLPLPVGSVGLAAATNVYDRPVEIDASLDGRTFFPVGAGELFGYPGADSGDFPLDTRARILRVRIRNGDDRPLGAVTVTVRHDVERILVGSDERLPYRVRYGAPLAPPDYDFARLPLAAVGGAGARPATLGPEHRLTVVATRKSRNEHWLVTLGLVLAALVVAGAGIVALRPRARTSS